VHKAQRDNSVSNSYFLTSVLQLLLFFPLW